MKWNKWSASAKKYINNNSDHISLVDLVKTHGEMIDELYEWIFGQFTEIHGKDIEEVNKLIDAVTPESVKAERERNKREH